MTEKKKYRWMILLMLGAWLMLSAADARAAFPYDMDEKPVWAWPLRMDEIKVYQDENLQTQTDTVSGSSLKLVAIRVSDQGIYGSYQDGETEKRGWFDQADFVYDMEYEHEYATVRAPMLIYTDESFDEVQDEIRKYSGVIAISQVGEDRQVIYEKKDHYGIGWMTEASYSDTLIYDGRHKQSLRDGAYFFRNGYLDSKTGGLIGQHWMETFPEMSWQLTCVSGDNYEISDPETGKYLAIVTKDGKAEPAWIEEPGSREGLFRLKRGVGAFTIQSLISRTYLTQDSEGKLSMTPDSTGYENHWRIRAQEKIQKNDDPFVITQYDPEWCATKYGGGGCMGTAGCGVLAPVNAVYALTGQYMDVMELADYAVEKNYRIVDNGTDDGIFKAACKAFGRQYGFAWDGHSGSIEKLKKKLNAGDVAVVHVEGHYVAVTAYDKKKDRYLMLDSNYLPKREDTPFGDWIEPQRLLEGPLEASTFYFYKLRDQ